MANAAPERAKSLSPSLLLLSFFFFSSRRRHTRSDRDWSSDVCSSDLDQPVPRRGRPKADAHVQLDIVAETQVHTRVELVHLLAARQRTAEQPGLTVVLDAQRDPLADRDADASARLHLPLPLAARGRECSLDHGIQLQLHPSDPLLQN